MFPKIGGKNPKMDGENNGSNPIKMDDLGGFPIIFGNAQIHSTLLEIWRWRGVELGELLFVSWRFPYAIIENQLCVLSEVTIYKEKSPALNVRFWSAGLFLEVASFDTRIKGWTFSRNAPMFPTLLGWAFFKRRCSRNTSGIWQMQT